MDLNLLDDKLSEFLKLLQVQEIIQSTTKEKITFDVELDIQEGIKDNHRIYKSVIILSINVEKKQGYSGYRKLYTLD